MRSLSLCLSYLFLACFCSVFQLSFRCCLVCVSASLTLSLSLCMCQHRTMQFFANSTAQYDSFILSQMRIMVTMLGRRSIAWVVLRLFLNLAALGFETGSVSCRCVHMPQIEVCLYTQVYIHTYIHTYASVRTYIHAKTPIHTIAYICTYIYNICIYI